MGKSSIHIQKASGGAITHNSRENYSKSVVFTDEKNELWNTKKEAYEIYREEINKRIEAYTNRTNQKLQKTAVTQLSAVINLEQHHTLKDLEKIKEELERVFDTKVYQMAIHRDEGKLKHKETGEYLVSGTDFFYNPNDDKYYSKKRVEDKKHIFENELNINEYDIEKNYHAHIEMLGLDSKGQAIRQKMNRFVLSNLQDFTAQSLEMERGNLFTNSKSNKRLDTHEFKAEKKRENELKKVVKNEKSKIVKKAKEIIKEEKAKLKSDLEELKKENLKFRTELKEYEAERQHYKKQEDLNKQLQADLKASKIDLSEALEKIEELKEEIFHPTFKTVSGYQLKNVDAVNYLVKEIEVKDTKIETLENENKSLQAQKEVLASKVITLQEKNDSRQNMSDYEAIKKENEELKRENASLKEKIKNILAAANEKIKSLFKFKIYNDVRFGYEKLNVEDWEKECEDDIRLEIRFNRDYEKELIQEPKEKERDIFKSKLDDVVDNQKELFQKLEKAKEKLNGVFPQSEKKKEEEHYHHRDNFLHR